jgi:hypothetical protein
MPLPSSNIFPIIINIIITINSYTSDIKYTFSASSKPSSTSYFARRIPSIKECWNTIIIIIVNNTINSSDRCISCSWRHSGNS